MLRSHLIILLGPSGVGKSTMLHYLENKYAVETSPKFTTRPSRNTPEDERDFIFCTDSEFPTEGILAFKSYGHLFGIDLEAIHTSFHKERSHAVIVGNCDVKRQLIKLLKTVRVIGIFVYCDLAILENRIFSDSHPHRSSRWEAIRSEISHIYPDIGCVDFVIDNSKSLNNTFDQIDKIVLMLMQSQEGN